MEKEFNLSEKLMKIKQLIESNIEDNNNCKLTYKEFHDRDIVYKAKLEVFEDIKEFIKWCEKHSFITDDGQVRVIAISKLKQGAGDEL